MTRLWLLLCGLLVAVVATELRYGGADGQVRPPKASAMQMVSPVPQRIVSTASSLDQWQAVALARPLFAPDRKPVAGSVAADAGLPRLTGLIAFGNDGVAIFQPAGNAKPISARNGDIVGGWEVVTIAGNAVGLRKANDRLLLSPKFDNLAGVVNIPVRQTPPRWEAPASSGMLRARWSNPQLQP